MTLRVSSSCTVALSDKGVFLNQLGRFDEAQELFDRAITKEPHLATAWYNKIHSKSISRNDPDRFAIEKLSSEYCSYRDRLLLEFALGKAYMGIGDVQEAFLHWTRGNRMKRNITTYDGTVEEKRMALAADWQPAIFATSVEAPRLSEVPIFIETSILNFL